MDKSDIATSIFLIMFFIIVAYFMFLITTSIMENKIKNLHKRLKKLEKELSDKMNIDDVNPILLKELDTVWIVKNNTVTEMDYIKSVSFSPDANIEYTTYRNNLFTDKDIGILQYLDLKRN